MEGYFVKRLMLFGVLLVVALGGAFSVAAGNGFPPITGAGQRTDLDIGTCNNEWASVSLDKSYKLTRTGDGTYNLEVKEHGLFTTIAGSSPGACESGTDNGNTVAGGVTGSAVETYNAVVTSNATPNTHPDCSSNSCPGTGAFLNAVFGAGNYTSGYATGAYSWANHYQAGSNGTWFDTSVNWPLNDRGDITGS
jgi:hypothetical protein